MGEEEKRVVTVKELVVSSVCLIKWWTDHPAAELVWIIFV